MSDAVRPHRRQPTRPHCPWDSPGKNTGVGCHFLLQCVKVKSESEVTQSYPTPSDPMDCSLPGSSIHGIFQARVLEGVPLPSPKCSVATHLIINNLRLENTSTGSVIIFPGHGLSLSLLHQEILSEMPWL